MTDDEFARSFKCGYVWEEISKSPCLTETFNKMDAELEKFAQGKRGPEGILLQEGYPDTPEIKRLTENFRAIMQTPWQRKMNICGMIDAMLDNDEYPQVKNIGDALNYIRKGYGV